MKPDEQPRLQMSVLRCANNILRKINKLVTTHQMFIDPNVWQPDSYDGAYKGLCI